MYLEDLAELPENPWALKGLTKVYAAMGPAAADKLSNVSANSQCFFGGGAGGARV